MTSADHTHIYEVRLRKDHLGVNLISDALPLRCALLTGQHAVNDAIDYAKFFIRSHAAVIRVYDDADNLIETHERRWAVAKRR
jgi:hypothetical protein